MVIATGSRIQASHARLRTTESHRELPSTLQISHFWTGARLGRAARAQPAELARLLAHTGAGFAAPWRPKLRAREAGSGAGFAVQRCGRRINLSASSDLHK